MGPKRHAALGGTSMVALVRPVAHQARVGLLRSAVRLGRWRWLRGNEWCRALGRGHWGDGQLGVVIVAPDQPNAAQIACLASRDDQARTVQHERWTRWRRSHERQ